MEPALCQLYRYTAVPYRYSSDGTADTGVDEHTFLHRPSTLAIVCQFPANCDYDLGAYTIKVKGQLVLKCRVKQTDGRTRPMAVLTPLTRPVRRSSAIAVQTDRATRHVNLLNSTENYGRRCLTLHHYYLPS